MTAIRLLPMAVVLDRVCMSKTQLYRLIKSGEFPKPVPVGRHRIGFVETEIDDWANSRIALRDAGVGAESRRESALRAVGGRK